MGYMRHHAIVVTSWDDKAMARARAKAVELCGKLVSSIIAGIMNGYDSFLVAPDGSKEGWTESSAGDDGRAALIAWLDTQRHEDGSGPLDWVEVQFGDEERETKVTAHSDEDQRQRPGQLTLL